jgi:hypothetical protein
MKFQIKLRVYCLNDISNIKEGKRQFDWADKNLSQYDETWLTKQDFNLNDDELEEETVQAIQQFGMIQRLTKI